MPPKAKMARKKPRAKATADSDSGSRPQTRAIVLIAAAALLFFSLFRYSPADLPVAGFFKSYAAAAEPLNPRENLMGVIGALLGLFQIQLFGAAAYLLPAILGWFGAFLLLGHPLRRKTVFTGLLLVVTGACLFDIFGWYESWQTRFNIAGPGGWFGHLIGHSIFETLISKVGAGILLSAAYLVFLIQLTGFHPIHFFSEINITVREWIDQQLHQLSEARDARQRSIDRKEKSRAASRKRHPLADSGPEDEEPKPKRERKKATDPTPTNEVAPVADNNPAPQIIDSSQKKVNTGNIGARPFERKKPDTPGGLETDGYEDYELPGFDLLEFDENDTGETEADTSALIEVQGIIVDTLKAFNVEVTPGDITRGPTITRYEIYPSTGLRVSRITQLESDLARATKAERINILAPIPGKDTVGIEIANDDKVAVPLRELLQDEGFRSAKKKIPLALGKDVYGNTVIGDLAAMPHLLVAGATGSGKSVCINSIITSILYKFGPDELRFIMVDPKVVEMQVYSKLPHLVVPVVTDPKKVVAALRWVVNEMERRYTIFAKVGVRNFDSFNSRPREEKPEEKKEEEPPEDPNLDPDDPEKIESIARAFEDGELGPPPEDENLELEMELDEIKIDDKLPYIVVIIDELADLMQTAPADVEMNIARIAQKARAAGIHLIVATQTPRADVVTGIIKANIPSRIAFQVSSALDSRVILDTKGADKLVGKGDMLFLPPGSAKLERSQGAFVSDEEVENIVNFCSEQTEQKFEKSIQDSIEKGGGDDGGADDVDDADEELLQRCIECVIQEQKASTSLLQRRLRLGYTRAARMIDIMEQRGIIGPGDGAKPRDILMKG